MSFSSRQKLKQNRSSSLCSELPNEESPQNSHDPGSNALLKQAPSAKLKIPAKALMFRQKKRKRDLTPLTSMPSRLECPRCGSGLRQLLAGIGGQMYVCMKCGYRGSVGLEPGLIKLDRKTKI